MMKPDPGWPIIVLMGVALGLSACTTVPDPPEAPQPPAVLPEGNLTEYEYAVATAECLTDRGWEVEVDGQGGWGVVSNLPDEQRPLYDADYQACLEEIGLGDFEVTAETASADYDNNFRVVNCLEREGFSVEEAPSRTSFITKTLEDPTALVWNPYSLVPVDELGKAVTACPQ